MHHDGFASCETHSTVGGQVVATLYRRSGPVKGRILFVNGAITTATALKWAVRGLTDFELVVFDFPNVGQSRPLNPGCEPVSMEMEGQIVAGLIEAYRPDYLISMSWGGASALKALSTRPPSVRRAIISSYSFGMTRDLQTYGEVIAAAAARGDREFGAAYAIDQLGEHLGHRLRRHYRDYFYNLDPAQERYILEHIRYVSSLQVEDHLADLRRIDIPALFANGARDRFTPPGSALPFAEVIRDARFVIIPDAGHFLGNESRPALEAVCEQIRAFWAPELAPPLVVAAE